MKFFVLIFLTSICIYGSSFQTPDKKREYYQLTIYHFANAGQEQMIDTYLEKALLPALHKKMIHHAGVFKPIANDTATDKLIYLLVPIADAEQMTSLSMLLLKDKDYIQAGKQYLETSYTNPAYVRMEQQLLLAFPLAPKMKLPALKNPRAEHVYEFRSYESASEQLYRNKVKMFNEGGEIELFKRLQFNAIFYAEVIAGSKMPNLVYMTSFENMDERDKHWKTFVEDSFWKKLSSMPEYQHNVSKADILLMKAASYSDY